MIRLFDLLFSLVGLLISLPLFIFVALWIKLDSQGPVFFTQKRIGKMGKPFFIYKFRSMTQKAEAKGQLTVGNRDVRITKSGRFLREFKIDELPQLINVLKGEMSLVGPRPEVEKYVSLYTEEQKKVLQVRPGITDLASIEYRNENEILAQSANPEKTYIEEIMPHKLALNQEFIQNPSLGNYFKILGKTVVKIFAN